MNIGRVLRAFVTAVRMTVRGEKIPSADAQIAAHYPKLDAWRRETLVLVDQIEAAAARELLDLTTVILTVDKRAVSAKTIVETVRYHAAQEYAFLLRQASPHTLLGIFATNLNDQHLIAQWQTIAPTLSDMLTALATHLRNIPQEKRSQSD